MLEVKEILAEILVPRNVKVVSFHVFIVEEDGSVVRSVSPEVHYEFICFTHIQ